MILRRVICAMGIALLPAVAAIPAAAQTAQQLASALESARQGNWQAAPRQAGPSGSVARDVIDWMRLRAKEGTPQEALAFVQRHPDWPGLAYLRRQNEPGLEGQSPAFVRRYFADAAPQTPRGALLLARALFADGQTDAALSVARDAWRTMPMGAATQDDWLRAFPQTLTALNDTRLDAMLWAGHYTSARAMLPLVSSGARALGQARLALYEQQNGVDAAISAVPAGLQSDPGLAHARATWRWRKGREADAYALMLEQSRSAESLGNPGGWAQLRRVMAREAMRDGAPDIAYRIASSNFLDPATHRSAKADLEWVAGFVALRQLNRPADALPHFERFDDIVLSPISKGRSGYWRGRTHAALGQADKAYAAYAQGAEFQSSFYGLLAAEQIGRPFDMSVATPPEVPPLNSAPFLSSSVFQAGVLLLAAGDLDLGERFLTHLTESLPADQASQLAQMSVDFNEPHLAVMIAKRAADRGDILGGAYYPMHPVADLDLPMAEEMVLAIARRESEFDPKVRSGAGALGLMQVMPATGSRMAHDIGATNHSTNRMLSDWVYNAKLGAEYLHQMAGEFDGNVILMAAAYNAGPSRPEEWLRRFGDPRRSSVDVVDWIEMIPFRETRNYVMRVSESLPVYRARLGETPLPIPFSRELAGDTLRSYAP